MSKIIKQQQNEDGQLKTHGSTVVGYLPINEIPSKGLFFFGDFVQTAKFRGGVYQNNLKESIDNSVKEVIENNLPILLKTKLPSVSRITSVSRRKRLLQIPESLIKQNNKVEIIPSKIIKISLETVVFECITDVKNQCYETREFPIILFEKYSFLKVGLVCNLNITLSPNNFNLKITNLNDSKIEHLFDTSSLFEGLEDLNVHYQ
jgi:hypothetical protein